MAGSRPCAWLKIRNSPLTGYVYPDWHEVRLFQKYGVGWTRYVPGMSRCSNFL